MDEGTSTVNDALRRLQANDRRTLKRAAEVLVEEAIRLTESRIGYFATLNKWERLLTMISWSKGAMAMCSMSNKPIVYPVESTGLWGDCVRERRPVITNDYEHCTRPTKKGIPEGHTPVARHMNVPVLAGGSIRGILGVGNRASEYTEADAALLQTFANEAWPFIDQAQQREEQRGLCPRHAECHFYSRRMPIHDVMFQAYFHRFCEGDHKECAIYQVVRRSDFSHVPGNLFPNQLFRVEEIVAHLPTK